MFRRSFLTEFENDPFFSGFSSHRDAFDSMSKIPDPIHLSINDGRHRERQSKDRHKDWSKNDRQLADTFGGFFSSMNNMMADMHQRMTDLDSRVDSDDPIVHSYSSSTVMSYRNDGKSKPKIYQATTSTRRAPGQIKETRRAVKDSERGLEKMAIGHHIGEKGRTIERRRIGGGELEEERNYFGMREEDEPGFNREWHGKTNKLNTNYTKTTALHGRKHSRDLPAKKTEIEAPRKYAKTPAAAHRSALPTRPYGPSKSGRERCKY